MKSRICFPSPKIIGSFLLAIGILARFSLLGLSSTMLFALIFHFTDTGLQGAPLGIVDNHNYEFETSLSQIENIGAREFLKLKIEQIDQILKDKIVIVVDDGVATGSTILATVSLIKEEEPSKIVVAFPVGSSSAINRLYNSPFIDEVVCIRFEIASLPSI